MGLQSVDATPFNAMLLHAARATDMARAAPHVPRLPWLEPDVTHTQYDGSAPLLRPLWSEHLFHLALRLGSREWLWWKAGGDHTPNEGMGTLSLALGSQHTRTGGRGARC